MLEEKLTEARYRFAGIWKDCITDTIAVKRELSADALRLQKKLDSGQKWVAKFLDDATNRTDIAAEILFNLRNKSLYPQSLQYSIYYCNKLWVELYSMMQQQYLRMIKLEPYAVELGMKYNRLTSCVISIRDKVKTLLYWWRASL